MNFLVPRTDQHSARICGLDLRSMAIVAQVPPMAGTRTAQILVGADGIEPPTAGV
jgi:hypothetical protein